MMKDAGVWERKKQVIGMKNIILIGFMGTGKTVIGRVLARQNGFAFVDTDKEVEDIMGMNICQIFRKHGERRFRSEEALAVKKLAKREGVVVATGGGVMMNEENAAILKENGFVVLLTAAPELLHERISRKNTRPLLGKNCSYEDMMKLLHEREAIYASYADLTVDTGELGVEEAVAAILAAYQSANEARAEG